MNRRVLLLLILLGTGVAGAADSHDHENEKPSATATEHEEERHEEGQKTGDEHGAHDEHEEGGVSLTDGQRRTIGLHAETLTTQEVKVAIEAPGEVRLNSYATSKVAPRIAAQIVKRHARLGDRVTKGAELVTLSSVAMATVQGDLKVAHREWGRSRRLGKDVVSERRYTEAKVAYELARAKVMAYGMTDAQVTAVLAGKAPASGEFVLLAPREGTVIADDFVEGDVVEPGRVLMTLTDESLLWVETQLTPEQAADVAIGAGARIDTPHGEVTGKVVQLRHAVNEATRTLDARLEVKNPDDTLHAGEFVTVRIDSTTTEEAFTVSEEAVLRSPDGDWQVFVEEEPGRYLPREVELVRTVGDRAVVQGLGAGTSVVTHGAFFLQSELAKGGFEIHQH
ncbi:efflux RND transporter periplasmic adaptor subunit [Thiohalomonas denitrificans]|uniref:efflux RND transporter periplasmic adaptor subunit n=1 Tax=Thiohalomonas denitrificans TaxID=415747 RepID=UPI0026E94F81|nr:efflux RND transporter periplasmic adaptor subunit [Thiohalomonas denitrificans]